MTLAATVEPVALPKAILFDWDNTLIDSWSVILAAMNHTLVELGHEPWSRVEIEARARLSLRDSFPTLFGAESPRAITSPLTASMFSGCGCRELSRARSAV